MNIQLNDPVSTLMTKDVRVVSPDTRMTEIAEIFETEKFHHIPVVEYLVPKGIISKSDYYQLQHYFTQLKIGNFAADNKKFFDSLIAEEVMKSEPVTIKEEGRIEEALDIFLQNEIHCLIVTKDDVCTGIITPYDFLKKLNLKV